MNGSARRLMILGASGLLGRYVAAAAADHDIELHLSVRTGQAPEVRCAAVHEINLMDHAAARRLLEGIRPSAIINCAGVVKSICHDGYEATMVNAALPHLLAQVLGAWGGRLVHVSTDCVFSGERGNYREDDLPDPVDLYGRSKLAGEVGDAPHLTVRTSFIGPEPEPAKGLLGWFLAQHGRVLGFRNAIWSGLTTNTLADILVRLALHNEPVGLLHVAGEAIDKASLLEVIARAFDKRDVDIDPVDEPVCDRSLDGNRLRSLGVVIPSIEDMVASCAASTKS